MALTGDEVINSENLKAVLDEIRTGVDSRLDAWPVGSCIVVQDTSADPSATIGGSWSVVG